LKLIVLNSCKAFNYQAKASLPPVTAEDYPELKTDLQTFTKRRKSSLMNPDLPAHLITNTVPTKKGNTVKRLISNELSIHKFLAFAQCAYIPRMYGITMRRYKFYCTHGTGNSLSGEVCDKTGLMLTALNPLIIVSI
jgi:hypothetical protein